MDRQNPPASLALPLSAKARRTHEQPISFLITTALRTPGLINLAAGLVDPITGEGLYYAVRSGDLASQVVLSDQEPEKNIEHYRQLIARDFGMDLTYGAGLAKRLFCGAVLFGAVPTRMIDFMKRSPKFCEIMQDLFAGTQPYLELKHRLLRNVNTTLHEILMSFLFRKLLLGENRI